MAINSVSSGESAGALRQRLRDALGTAIKSRNRTAVSALRSTLAAIDNAEAVDRDASVDRRLAIEQIPVGVGAAEVARRELTEQEVAEIVRGEVADREAAADGYERAGRTDHAARLREEINVLAEHLKAEDSDVRDGAAHGDESG